MEDSHEITLPSVKTEECNKLECDSSRYYECPNCLIYRCSCAFQKCEECCNYHCFKGKCGEVTYFKTMEEQASDLWMEFEYRDYVGSPGRKVFNCKISASPSKCALDGCDFECYPWDERMFMQKCCHCSWMFCGDHIKECSECGRTYCDRASDNVIRCGCNTPAHTCDSYICSICNPTKSISKRCLDCEDFCAQ